MDDGYGRYWTTGACKSPVQREISLDYHCLLGKSGLIQNALDFDN